MIATLVHVKVLPEFVEAFKIATIANHESSILENGNRRFDVLQSKDNTCYFILYEAYQSEADAKAHKETPHYALWRDTVASMMAEPRQGVAYQAICP